MIASTTTTITSMTYCNLFVLSSVFRRELRRCNILSCCRTSERLKYKDFSCGNLSKKKEKIFHVVKLSENMKKEEEIRMHA